MLRSFLTLVSCACAMTSFGQTGGSKPPAWITWKGAGISLAHPVEWKADASGAQGTTVVFMSPMDSGDVFQENVNLLIQDAKDMDLPSYIRITEEQVRTILISGTMLHSSTQRNSTGEYHQFEYTGELNGAPLHWKQVVRITGGEAYLLTFTAHKDAWDEDLYMADAILDSFKWTEK